MSFIITVYTNEGIIMASDSRTTYTTTKTLSDGTVEKNVGVQLTDTTYKTFKCNSRIGLSTCGTASINDMPIAGFNASDNKQHISRVYVGSNQVKAEDISIPGAIWDGEIDVLQRIIKKVGLKNNDGTYSDLNFYGIGFNYFTLQDAIDFAQYAVDSTIKTMFFQNRVKTVGGPIDILAIKPSGTFWVQRKELQVKRG